MKLLIVDDSPVITRNIATYLTHHGHQCIQAADGETAFEELQKTVFDCIVLDRMMPRLDGMGLTRILKARGNTTPVIFLTALGKTVDRIEGLTLGADDYLVKPFDLEELRLRIMNVVERSRKGRTTTKVESASSVIDGELSYGPIHINTRLAKTRVDGRTIPLSPREYEILRYFLEHPETIISRDQLYEDVWGNESSELDSLDTVNVHIAHLRKKLGINCIQTIKHQGYALELA